MKKSLPSSRSVNGGAGGDSAEDEGEMIQIISMLEQKEKDLELAAKIGKHLLEQNQELKDRNDFIQDSLNKSLDTISELRHQVRHKEKLIKYIRTEDDLDTLDSHHNPSISLENLRSKVDSLKREKLVLKNETNELKSLNISIEDEKNELADQCTRQLDRANLQIAKLQSVINDKNLQCKAQLNDIEKLIREIHERKTREKEVIEMNDCLSDQLEDIVVSHENLKNEICEYQEKYTEVFGMLKEAEDELSRHRKRSMILGRTLSTDSLYDSLASELEVHDSGFFTTPMISARSDSRGSNFNSYQREEDMLRSNKYTPIEENLSDELAAIGYDTVHNRNTASLAILAELTPQFETKHAPDHPNDPCCEAVTPVVNEIPFLVQPIHNVVNIKKISQMKDTSCSPIKEFVIEDNLSSGSNESTPRAVNQKIITSHHDTDSESEMVVVKPKTRLFKHSQSIDIGRVLANQIPNKKKLSIADSSSSDSLSEYTAPKLGAPGKLGTRDLEYCIRKIDTRKVVEKEYQSYRAKKGLGPSKFPLFFIGLNKNVDPLADKIGPLTRQFVEMNKSKNIGRALGFLGPALNSQYPVIKSSSVKVPSLKSQPSFDCQSIEEVGINSVTLNEHLNSGIISRNHLSENQMPCRSSSSTPTKGSFPRKIIKNLNFASLTNTSSSPTSLNSLIRCGFSRESSPTSSNTLNLMAPMNGIVTRTDIYQNQHL